MQFKQSPVTRLPGVLVAAGVAALSLLAAPSQAQSLMEGFESVPNLQLAGSGWSFQNLSTLASANTWGQGSASSTTSIGPAPFGTATSYAVANFTATGSTAATGATISDWMITPTLTYVNGSTVTFFTRTSTTAQFPDRMEVRFSSAGASTNVGATPTSVGDFTKVLLTINPNLAPGPANYPGTWTSFTTTLSGLSGATSGRVAFRYFDTDAGVNGLNSDIIGVDSLTIAAPAVVPEPSQYAALSLGVLGLGALALKARRRGVTAA